MSESEDYAEIQNKTKCGWCRNPMVMSEPVTDANFVQTDYTWHNRPLYALYCSSCLENEVRVKDPKVGIDKETLEEIDVYLIAEVQDKDKAAANNKSMPPSTAAAEEAATLK